MKLLTFVPTSKSSANISIFINICFSDKSFRKYLTDWTNWFDMLAISMTLLIIPFRFTNLNVQWIFAALAYIFHGLRIFEYAIILRYISNIVINSYQDFAEDFSDAMLKFWFES